MGGASHWKYLDQLEYERPILVCLRRQILRVRHDLKGSNLTDLGSRDKCLSARVSPYDTHASEEQSTSRCSGKPIDVAHFRLPIEISSVSTMAGQAKACRDG
jgi:hypothetical protein